LTISNNQELFLFRNKEGVPDKTLWKLLHSHFFEFAVQGNYRRDETEGVHEFDNWVLSGDALKGHTMDRPSKVENLKDGLIVVTVDATTQFEGKVPPINAVMRSSVGYTMTSSLADGESINPVPEYSFQYAHPVPLNQILVHEELFRELLDFVWCRGHGIPAVYLKLRGRRSRLLRKAVHVGNTADPYRALQFNRYLKSGKEEGQRTTSFVQENLLSWCNKWYSMTDTDRRPFVQAARLLKSPSMQTDLRFASALHCLESLDKKKQPRVKTDGKSPELKERLKGLSHRWIDVDRPPTSCTLHHLDRVAYTRNDIIHLEPHPKQVPGDLLEGTQITRAYFEAMVMIRASFLDAMGMKESIGDDYAHSALKELSLIQFRYS
jgi:hypothetical protein